jgi:hypothetical protein
MQLASMVADDAMGVINAPPLHTAYGIPDARLAAPAEPQKSLLVYRPTIRGPGQMPPVGTMKVDGEGVALLAKWISEMSAAPSPASAQKP